MPASGKDRGLAGEAAKTLAMSAARNNPGLVIMAVAVAFVIFILLFLSSLVAVSASHLPSVYEKGPGPYAKAKIPAEMLAIYTSAITKRECPSLDWSILAAIVHSESSDGRKPKGNFNPYPLPRDPGSSGTLVANPSAGQQPSGPSVRRTEVPEGGWSPGQTGMFTSSDPGVAVPYAGKLDWVAVKIGGGDGATREEILNLQAAGIPIVIWQDSATQEGVWAVEEYGAVGYIAQAEGPGQLDAAVAVEDQITVDKWLVTNVYEGMVWPDGGWGAMPEAYKNANPQATPERVTARAIQVGADPNRIIIATGSYDASSEIAGGTYVPLEEYAPGVERSGAMGIAIFSGEGMQAQDHEFLHGLDGSTPSGGGRGRSGGGPRYGATQFVITFYDKKGNQQVVKFRVRPDVTPEGKPKAKGFNNPNNPWDTGYAGDINADAARMYGWSGELVEGWDYEAGAPKYEIDPRTKRRFTKYKYDPGTKGPKGDKIPYYRVPDGQGYALDGDGDGDADINNPADAIPMLARYLCANGAGTHAKLMTAVYNYRPVDWYLIGSNPRRPSFPGILVLAKRFANGGPPLIGRSAPTTWTTVPGGPNCSVVTSLDNQQTINAEEIKAEARKMQAEGKNITERDIKIALKTAMQESKLKDLPPGQSDGDSVGIFQQLSSYGTVEQRMDTAFATRGFFNEMLRVLPTGRDQLPEIEVALLTQRPKEGAYESSSNAFESWDGTARKLMGEGAEPNPACETNRGAPGLVEIADGANLPGRPVQPITLDFLSEMASIYGKKLICTTGTNHDYLTVDKNPSDHVPGWACDFGMAANGGYDDSPVGDAIMTACLIAGGVPPVQALQMAQAGDLYTLTHRGLRIQCIWKTDKGGNHHNHVHAAAKPA